MRYGAGLRRREISLAAMALMGSVDAEDAVIDFSSAGLYVAGIQTVFAVVSVAVVSVLADYVYIGGPSPAHGVDRVLASFNFLRLAFLLSQEAPELFALGLVPAALFVYAQRMKDLDRPGDWQLAHGLWHASGAAVACAATYSIS